MNIKKLMENPYAWAVLSMCTIVALIFAIYTWFAGKKKKEISYFKSTFKVVKAGKSVIPKLDLLYDGQNIDDLTITKYAIWNSGNEVLNWSDIVIVSPLRIICNNAKILDVQIIEQSDETNAFKILDKKDNYVKIEFDYVNINDGIVIQILHTGDAADIDVDCRIKGGRKPRNFNHNLKKNSKKNKKHKIIAITAMGIDVFMIWAMSFFLIAEKIGIITEKTLKNTAFFSDSINDTFGIILLLILAVIILITYIKLIKRTFYIGVPIKLRKNIGCDNFEND